METWQPYNFDNGPLDLGGGYAICNIWGVGIVEPDIARMGIQADARRQAIEGLDELIGILNRRLTLRSFVSLWFALERARATIYLTDWMMEAGYRTEERFRNMFGRKLNKGAP